MAGLPHTRHRWRRFDFFFPLLGIGAIAFLLSLTQARAQVASWEIEFPAAPNGKVCKSIAVPLEDGSALVAILLPGAEAGQPVGHRAGDPAAVEVIGHDPVSRLCFLKSSKLAERIAWAKTAPFAPGTALHAPGPLRARANGWVKQIGTKVLPFALLRISFEGPVPATGTPLSGEDGRVVALVYQPATGNTAYAIPTEAIQRVRPDICGKGKLTRGWLGLSLRAESPTPVVTRLTADSPALQAGIRANDVLLQIGTRAVNNYADAADAFFYLIPGEPVKLRLLRGADQLDFTVNPVVTPVGK